MSKTRMCSYINWSYLGRVFVALLLIVLFCEFFIYYVVLLKCSWPQLNESLDGPRPVVTERYKPVKAMILSDTHLLGRRGHWFDKLRREWQMYRAFQTVMTIHNPDVVFFLGDLFDEGIWAESNEFHQYANRFKNLFSTPEKTKVYVAAGNHDVGFHYLMRTKLHDRFVKAFNAPAVNLVIVEGNAFIMLNSMAMEGDGCTLCAGAERNLKAIGKRLFCDKAKTANDCEPFADIPLNTRPIMLQHFPMYRQSEAVCVEPDSPPAWEKTIANREKWECLSKDSSQKIIKWLKPRLIFGGHTHHGCRVLHDGNIDEWTVASFNWRNKNNPSFLLATFTPDNHAISKCYLPQESAVITIYVASGFGLLLWIIVTRRRFFRANIYAKIS